MILYGIPTCDTCRKALSELRAAGASPVFHDLRADPLPAAEIARFLADFGPRLVNRASTTWRGLNEAERARPWEELLAEHPTLMKRPLIVDGARQTLGWTAAERAVWLPPQ